MKDKIENYLLQQGYRSYTKPVPKNFTWTPDVFVHKKEEFLAILIRHTNSVPESLVQRIASMNRPISKTRLLIIFTKRPSKTTVDLVKLYGVSIKLFLKNKFIDVGKIVQKKDGRKETRKKIERTKIKKMPKTDIFLSSHQQITERKKAKKIIKDLFPTYGFPLNPIMVEDDSRYNIKQTNTCINRNLEDCDWFLGILAEEHRPIVEDEVKKIFKKLNHHDILLFVKSTRRCKSNWKKLLDWVKNKNTVKYTEYTDLNDFESKLKHSLMIRVKEYHTKNNIPFLE